MRWFPLISYIFSLIASIVAIIELVFNEPYKALMCCIVGAVVLILSFIVYIRMEIIDEDE